MNPRNRHQVCRGQASCHSHESASLGVGWMLSRLPALSWPPPRWLSAFGSLQLPSPASALVLVFAAPTLLCLSSQLSGWALGRAELRVANCWALWRPAAFDQKAAPGGCDSLCFVYFHSTIHSSDGLSLTS